MNPIHASQSRLEEEVARHAVNLPSLDCHHNASSAAAGIEAAHPTSQPWTTDSMASYKNQNEERATKGVSLHLTRHGTMFQFLLLEQEEK
jgi:hypothetical protein